MSYVYNVIYDLIQGEGSVPNCTASYWSVLFTLVSHITILYFDDLIGPNKSHDLIHLHGSFQLYQVGILCKQDYS